MDLDLSKIEKVFFIGIGGIGISALAKMAISCGMEVSGINDDESPIVAVRKVQYLMKSLLETPFFSNLSKKSLSFSIGTSSDVVKVLIN